LMNKWVKIMEMKWATKLKKKKRIDINKRNVA
jgi:hypothetical protein